MSPGLADAVARLEAKAASPSISPRQRGILDALKDLGAVRAAESLESMLLTEERVRRDALEDVAFLRAVVK
jgi:hypothetical protein